MMERNEAMVLDDILYHLYDAEDFTAIRRGLLERLHMLVQFSYASILRIETNGGRMVFRDPLCVPEALLPMEEQYIRIAEEDHTLWSTDRERSGVICESSMLSDEARLSTPVYRQCYARWNIYDTLQVNIAYHGLALGVLTLYRTRAEGTFREEDVFSMNIISHHLNRLFYRRLVAENPAGRRAARVQGMEEKYGLTRREGEILARLLTGASDEDIAAALVIAPGTLKKHLQHIYRKLQITARWELLKFTEEGGAIPG